MQDNFAFFFKRVLEDEGVGFEDVPGDNGGPTKCGITIADVARFNGVRCPGRGGPGWDGLVAKVRALDPAQAGIIYKKFYWDEVRADDLLSGLDYSVVDYAVNSGTGRAVPVLHHLVGVGSGAVVDDTLLDAIRNGGDVRDLINRYQDERKAFLEHISEIPHNAKFRRGWLDRESRVRKVALNLVGKDPVPAITASHPKAVGEHPNDATMGIAGAAAGAVAADAPPPLAPPASTEPPPLQSDKPSMLSMAYWSPHATAVNDIADQGSRIGESLRTIKGWFHFGWISAVGGGGVASQVVDTTSGSTGHAILQVLARHWPLLAIGGLVLAALLFYYSLKRIETGLVSAYAAGRYKPRGA